MPIGFDPNSVQLCGYNKKDNTFFDLDKGEISPDEAENGIVFLQGFEQQGYSAIKNDFYPKMDNGNGIVSIVAYRLLEKEADNTEMFRLYFKRISDEPANIQIVDEKNKVYDDTLPNGASFYYAGNELDYDITFEGEYFTEGTKPGHHEGKNYNVKASSSGDKKDNDADKASDNGVKDTDAQGGADIINGSSKEGEKRFSDVPADHWAYDAIISLAGQGVINGYENGTFEPGKNITRAEIATIAARATGLSTENIGSLQFNDVSGSEWFVKYLAAAYGAGIVAGYDDNTFRPNELVTRQDLCCMLYRAFFKDAEAVDSEMTFSDREDISDYSVEAVSDMCGRGILSGRENNTFCPKQYATRAEVARVVYMCLKYEGGVNND